MRKIRISMLSIAFTLLGIMSIKAQEKKDVTDAFKPSMKIEGRIMYDFNFLSAGDDYSFAGNEFRRLRMAAKGTVTKNIGYKVEFDFAGGKVNYRDVYLKFALPSNAGNVMLGSFTEPTSLNNMTSSKYITFFERAMLANTQPFKYNAGVMYDNQKLLGGNLGLQLAYTFNGNKSEGFKDKDVDGGGNFIARVTTALLKNKEKNQVVHLGVNYEHRDNDSDKYAYKLRTENHMGNKQKVSASGNFKNTSDIGFEAAATFGPLSVQSEYELSSIVTNVDTYKANAYYAFVSYFITGEHRPYKNSSFGRVKPKADFCLTDGTWGALELVARYSVMDLNDNIDLNGNDNKDYKIANITAGFNWYLNKHTRIMYNFTSGNHGDLQAETGKDALGNPIYGQIYGDDNLIGHLIRFQIDF